MTKDGTLLYFAKKHDRDASALKPKCCPNMPARKIARSVHEAARDKARAIAKTEAYVVSRRERKKVEMLFAHLKRILGLGKLRLRGLSGAKGEFLLAATAQNLRKLAKLIPFGPDLRHMRRRASSRPPRLSPQPSFPFVGGRGSSTESAETYLPALAKERQESAYLQSQPPRAGMAGLRQLRPFDAPGPVLKPQKAPYGPL